MFGAIQIWGVRTTHSVAIDLLEIHYGKRFREGTPNVFWKSSHSWNWLSRHIASRNAQLDLYMRCVWLTVLS